MNINSGIENYLKNTGRVDSKTTNNEQIVTNNEKKLNTEINTASVDKGDKVTLSEAAKAQLEAETMNKEKIQRLKISIESGNYSVDYNKLADQIIKFEKSLF